MGLILIAAVTAAVAASVGYLASRRRAEEPQDERPAPPEPEPAEKRDEALSQFPLQIGDVVSAGGEERWLAGALVARDRGEATTVVFIAPEGATHGAVVAFAPPRRDIQWLAPVDVESPDEPPATLEIAGVAMRRRGRLPVSIERLGQGAPRIGETGILATYEGGPSEAALVITCDGRTHAWAGRPIDEGAYERLGAGGD